MNEPHSRRPPAVPVQKLPARVRDVISREQDASEILIGWVQLGVVLTFAALYYLSPKQPGANPMISPEPWVLAGYVLFTLVRLHLAIGAAYRTGCCTSRWSWTWRCCWR